jgi:hypothetical protein
MRHIIRLPLSIEQSHDQATVVLLVKSNYCNDHWLILSLLSVVILPVSGNLGEHSHRH